MRRRQASERNEADDERDAGNPGQGRGYDRENEVEVNNDAFLCWIDPRERTHSLALDPVDAAKCLDLAESLAAMGALYIVLNSGYYPGHQEWFARKERGAP